MKMPKKTALLQVSKVERNMIDAFCELRRAILQHDGHSPYISLDALMKYTKECYDKLDSKSTEVKSGVDDSHVKQFAEGLEQGKAH